MVKDINFGSLYSEAFFKPCYFLLTSYNSSQHPIFKRHQYAPFIMQEKMFNNRAELYEKLYVFTFKSLRSRFQKGHHNRIAKL